MKKILYTHFPEYFDNKYADGGEMDAPKHWEELSMADKSDAIASAVRNGVTTLEDIRKAWDDYADSSYQEETHEYHHATDFLCSFRGIDDEETEAYIHEHLFHKMLCKIDDWTDKQKKVSKKPKKKA